MDQQHLGHRYLVQDKNFPESPPSELKKDKSFEAEYCEGGSSDDQRSKSDSEEDSNDSEAHLNNIRNHLAAIANGDLPIGSKLDLSQQPANIFNQLVQSANQMKMHGNHFDDIERAKKSYIDQQEQF